MLAERHSLKEPPVRIRRWSKRPWEGTLLFLTLIVLVLSLSACSARDPKSQIVGKWEATITQRGTDTKILWEFLPDGTFQCAPFVDPTVIVDKDKYELLDEGRSVKIRSQFIPASCILTLDGNTMSCDSPEVKVRFKKL